MISYYQVSASSKVMVKNVSEIATNLSQLGPLKRFLAHRHTWWAMFLVLFLAGGFCLAFKLLSDKINQFIVRATCDIEYCESIIKDVDEFLVKSIGRVESYSRFTEPFTPEFINPLCKDELKNLITEKQYNELRNLIESPASTKSIKKLKEKLLDVTESMSNSYYRELRSAVKLHGDKESIEGFKEGLLKHSKVQDLLSDLAGSSGNALRNLIERPESKESLKAFKKKLLEDAKKLFSEMCKKRTMMLNTSTSRFSNYAFKPKDSFKPKDWYDALTCFQASQNIDDYRMRRLLNVIDDFEMGKRLTKKSKWAIERGLQKLKNYADIKQLLKTIMQKLIISGDPTRYILSKIYCLKRGVLSFHLILLVLSLTASLRCFFWRKAILNNKVKQAKILFISFWVAIGVFIACAGCVLSNKRRFIDELINSSCPLI